MVLRSQRQYSLLSGRALEGSRSVEIRVCVYFMFSEKGAGL